MRRISIHRKADRKDPAFGYVNFLISLSLCVSWFSVNILSETCKC